jgi:hypothetical protein
MKQEIGPKAFVVIIAVAVVLLVGGVWWVWKAPSAPAAASSTTAFHPHPGGAREQAEAMRAERMGRGMGQATAPQNTAR